MTCRFVFPDYLLAVLFAVAALVCLGVDALAAAPDPAPEPEPKPPTITLCGHELTRMTPAEVRERGFPWADVPDAKNAAMLYVKGAEALHKLQADEHEKWPRWHDQFRHAIDNRWDDGLDQLAAFLAAAKPALDLYRKGAAREQCQLPYWDAEMLAGMLLPTLAKARLAARLLCADARRLEAKRQFKDAIDRYLAAMAIGRHYGRGRTMMDYLVGVACLRLATEAAHKGLLRHAYPAAELRRFGKKLDAIRDLPDPAHAYRAERAFGLGTVDDLIRLGPGAWRVVGVGGGAAEASPLETRLLRILLPDRTVRKDMAGFYDRTIEAAKLPYHKPEARKDAMAGVKPWNVFAQMLLPALSRSRAAGEGCRASFRMLRVAVALELYRHETGVYPDSLQWLVQDQHIPKVPVDPFSGKPLRYRQKGGTYTLWSVGENLKDDGGAIDRDARGRPADLGVTSKLPAVRPWK
jgi:hypothetical protein